MSRCSSGFIEESEARDRWCPIMMTGRPVRKSEKWPKLYDIGCLGSECMAWVTSEANEDFGRCGLVNR